MKTKNLISMLFMALVFLSLEVKGEESEEKRYAWLVSWYTHEGETRTSSCKSKIWSNLHQRYYPVHYAAFEAGISNSDTGKEMFSDVFIAEIDPPSSTIIITESSKYESLVSYWFDMFAMKGEKAVILKCQFWSGQRKGENQDMIEDVHCMEVPNVGGYPWLMNNEWEIQYTFSDIGSFEDLVANYGKENPFFCRGAWGSEGW